MSSLVLGVSKAQTSKTKTSDLRPLETSDLETSDPSKPQTSKPQTPQRLNCFNQNVNHRCKFNVIPAVSEGHVHRETLAFQRVKLYITEETLAFQSLILNFK